ncbi:MAG: hypothetical protein J0L62_05180 [Bacteroidetes bacterium]|nr:hypothetical protein [Bacteroidota bacterium]
MKTKITSGIHLFILLSFLLPWMTISCENKTVASLTGIDFLTGKKIESKDAFDQTETRYIPASFYTIATAGLVVICFFLGFLRTKTALVFVGILDFTTLALHWWFKTDLEQKILAEGNGLFQIKPEMGFWLVTLFLFAGIGWIGFLLMQYIKNKDL